MATFAIVPPERLDRWVPYVGGEWLVPDADRTQPVIDPATGAQVGTVSPGTTAEVDQAVTAAGHAFGPWHRTDLDARLSLLGVWADELDRRAESLAELITSEVGTPIKLSRRVQVGLPRTTIRSTIELAAAFPWEQHVQNSLVVGEPVGVVAAITPWNYPLHQAMCKIAPALAVGCTVVLKPASLTPLHALALADAANAAGLPPGVLNVVPGTGRAVGERLVTHPDVDMVTFTGSTEVGRSVGALAAATVKRVGLELGGKSACVILDDADLPSAIRSAVRNGLLNSGQTCSAWTRIVVPRAQLDQAADIAGSVARQLVIGDPHDEQTHLGPLISAEHKAGVSRHIERARRDGLTEVYAGECDEGNYLAPHVFSDVTPDHRLAQEEVFGPVLAIMPADGDDDAVAIANSTMYGLAGGVFSGDENRALAVARRIRTGQVDINGGAFNPKAPFGGYRQSGNGRELGIQGIAEFLEYKAIQR